MRQEGKEGGREGKGGVNKGGREGQRGAWRDEEREGQRERGKEGDICEGICTLITDNRFPIKARLHDMLPVTAALLNRCITDSQSLPVLLTTIITLALNGEN